VGGQGREHMRQSLFPSPYTSPYRTNVRFARGLVPPIEGVGHRTVSSMGHGTGREALEPFLFLAEKIPWSRASSASRAAQSARSAASAAACGARTPRGLFRARCARARPPLPGGWVGGWVGGRGRRPARQRPSSPGRPGRRRAGTARQSPPPAGGGTRLAAPPLPAAARPPPRRPRQPRPRRPPASQGAGHCLRARGAAPPAAPPHPRPERPRPRAGARAPPRRPARARPGGAPRRAPRAGGGPARVGHARGACVLSPRDARARGRNGQGLRTMARRAVLSRGRGRAGEDLLAERGEEELARVAVHNCARGARGVRGHVTSSAAGWGAQRLPRPLNPQRASAPRVSTQGRTGLVLDVAGAVRVREGAEALCEVEVGRRDAPAQARRRGEAAAGGAAMGGREHEGTAQILSTCI
jgi:hypothetical protein